MILLRGYFNMIHEMKSFVLRFVKRNYPQCDIKKMNKKYYQDDMNCAYLGGFLTACEEVFKRNKAGNYIHKDDVIADLHLMYKEHYDFFRLHYGFKTSENRTLDKIIKFSEAQNDNEITFC